MLSTKKVVASCAIIIMFFASTTSGSSRHIDFSIEEMRPSYKMSVAKLRFQTAQHATKRRIVVNSHHTARLALSRGQYKKIRGVVTAYTSSANECGNSRGITATGTKVKEYHTVAVNKRIIPIGSYIFIPDFAHWPNHGIFMAEDTGSGNFVVDIYVKTKDHAFKIGRKTRDIYIIK